MRFLLTVLFLLLPVTALARVQVVASINDLASIAASVGGDEVETTAIARPTADVHRVEILPSYMVRVARARVYLKVGLGLDRWAEGVIDGSRNGRLAVVDCSQGVPVLEKPTGRVDASMGDVHPEGNPHYWLDPRNGAVIARTIAEALAGVDPGHADDYRGRAEAYAAQVQVRYDQQVARLGSMPSRAILTYHASWPYLAAAYGLDVVDTVEPVPGIPPTARHLQELVDLVRSREVRAILQEPYFSDEATDFLLREAHIPTVHASASCDAPTAGSYLDHFDALVASIATAR